MNKFTSGSATRSLIAAAIVVVLAVVAAGCGGGSRSTGSIDGYVYKLASGSKHAVQGRLAVTPSNNLMVSGIGLKPEGYEPAMGVKVLVEGTNLSCITDGNGYFRINGIYTGTQTVVVSDGYNTLRFTVQVLANRVTHVGTQVGYYLFIGINNYQNPNMNLDGCVADAESMKEALYDSTPFIGECKLLTSYSTATIKNATKDEVRKAILDIKSKMAPQDFFVMYFSGHGYRSSTVEAICPSDTYDTNDISHMIRDSELAEWLGYTPYGNTPNKNITVILDACNSGSFINGEPKSGYSIGKMKARAVAPVRMRALKDKGYSVLTAAKEDEYSYEVNGHGLFTFYLAEGLDAAHRSQTDANRDGIITVQELYDYAAPLTTKAAYNLTDEYGTPLYAQQHPQIWLGSNPPVLRY